MAFKPSEPLLASIPNPYALLCVWGPGGLGDPYRNDSLLQHVAWCVMQVGELHCHLVVDGEQQVLSGLQLALQLPAVLVGELGGPCRLADSGQGFRGCEG